MRRCNFCLRREPEASFDKEAHVIPFAFGRPKLTSLNECDECNADGSALEGDLASGLGVHRALSGHPGRGGFPTVQIGKWSWMKWDAERKATLVHLDPRDFIGDGFAFQVPKYRPMNVARALARMALFFVDEPEQYAGLRAWVQRKPGSDRGASPWLVRAEYMTPMPLPFLVVQKRRFGDALWYRTTFAFHTALFMMCVGEPDWIEPSVDELIEDAITPDVEGPPSGHGHIFRCRDGETTTPYPFSPGAIRAPES